MMGNGIAHVSFRGGGLFLPARSPYDYQLLREHVTARVRTNGHVQVLLNDRRWLVERSHNALRCSSCGKSPEAVCHPTPHGPAGYCLSCAFSAVTGEAPAVRERQRLVG